MLELSALGLLQRQPLHGYRLKQQLELFMSSCISVNYGAIYPLLKRLLERGEISVIAEEAGDAGCPRKIYGITAQGRELWRQKMLEHPQESWVNSGSRFQIKFFFFGDLESAERLKLLEHRLRVSYIRQDYIESLKSEYPLTDDYQFASRDRCKSVLALEIEWLTEQLAKEKSAIAGVRDSPTFAESADSKGKSFQLAHSDES
ncbi:PadR family transcriptional regulator [filamentous cyanobacterium Phorm 46]|nr:PadR family transcriptional regulator [filamentous cyanobacterium Phorm 46]PSB50534.1 PadR family transcriptional regulator [filamentous cyanobacterium Phorm 6]